MLSLLKFLLYKNAVFCQEEDDDSSNKSDSGDYKKSTNLNQKRTNEFEKGNYETKQPEEDQDLCEMEESNSKNIENNKEDLETLGNNNKSDCESKNICKDNHDFSKVLHNEQNNDEKDYEKKKSCENPVLENILYDDEKNIKNDQKEPLNNKSQKENVLVSNVFDNQKSKTYDEKEKIFEKKDSKKFEKHNKKYILDYGTKKTNKARIGNYNQENSDEDAGKEENKSTSRINSKKESTGESKDKEKKEDDENKNLNLLNDSYFDEIIGASFFIRHRKQPTHSKRQDHYIEPTGNDRNNKNQIKILKLKNHPDMPHFSHDKNDMYLHTLKKEKECALFRDKRNCRLNHGYEVDHLHNYTDPGLRDVFYYNGMNGFKHHITPHYGIDHSPGYHSVHNEESHNINRAYYDPRQFKI